MGNHEKGVGDEERHKWMKDSLLGKPSDTSTAVPRVFSRIGETVPPEEVAALRDHAEAAVATLTDVLPGSKVGSFGAALAENIAGHFAHGNQLGEQWESSSQTPSLQEAIPPVAETASTQ